MNTRHIASFLRVAQFGSISQAALASGISQPVVTRHIQELEASLHVRLLHRRGHGVVLTEAGARLLPHLQALTQQAELAEQDALLLSGGALRRATLAVPPTLIRVLAVPLTRAILAEAPDLKLRLVDAFSGTLAEWVAEGKVDVAVLYASGVSARVQSEKFLIERLHLIGPPDTPETEATAFADLIALRLILPSRSHGLRRTVEQYAADAGIKLPVQIEADSFTAILELVAAGHGSTILPKASVAPEIAQGRLIATPIVSPVIERDLCLATARNRALPPGTARLLHIVKTTLRSLNL